MTGRYLRRRKYYRTLKRTKYSNETYAAITKASFQAANQYYATMIKETNILATRKVKNFTLTFSTNADGPFFWALVYVPEGTSPSNLNAGSGFDTSHPQQFNVLSMYEPNQNVIMSGTFGGSQGQTIRYKTRLARNLCSGDQIMLIYRPIANYSSDVTVISMLNYAICF